MPNVALIPAAATRIPALQADVDGFPEVTHRLETSKGGEPLEDGAEVTDHAVSRQAQLTLTGHISGLTDAAGSPPAVAYAHIERLQREATPIQVITPIRTYNEMLIVRVNAPQKGPKALEFRMELSEIQRVGVTETELTPANVSGPAAGRTSEVPRGRVHPTPFTGPQ